MSLTRFTQLSFTLLCIFMDSRGLEVHRVQVITKHYSIQVNEYREHSKYTIGTKRYTRDASDSITATDNVKENSACVDRYDIQTVHGRRDQKALIIDLAGSAVLPCHFCDAAENITRQAMLWFKFKQTKEKTQTLWQAKEVVLDMHDDEKLNRVYVTLSHNLIIRDFQPQDVGTYFCEPYKKGVDAITHYAFRSKHIDSMSAASFSVAWKRLTGVRKINFLHHLDIEIPMKALRVSADGYDRPKPKAPLVSKTNNWVTYTDWMAWNNCSMCGVPGKREKRGHCRVKILDKMKLAKPAYLDHIFRFYQDGVPCHSNFFKKFPHIVKRNHETMIEECIEACPGNEHKGPEILDVGKIEIVNTGSEVEYDRNVAVPRFHITTNIGNTVILICPTVLINPSDETEIESKRKKRSDQPDEEQKDSEKNSKNYKGKRNLKKEDDIIWVSGSRSLSQFYLLKTTHGRVYITDSGYLNITNVTRIDNRIFSCWQEDYKFEYASYRIEVVPRTEKEENKRKYFIYLGLSYILDFIIFFIISIFKFRKTVTQVKRAKK